MLFFHRYFENKLMISNFQNYQKVLLEFYYRNKVVQWSVAWKVIENNPLQKKKSLDPNYMKAGFQIGNYCTCVLGIFWKKEGKCCFGSCSNTVVDNFIECTTRFTLMKTFDPIFRKKWKGAWRGKRKEIPKISIRKMCSIVAMLCCIIFSPKKFTVLKQSKNMHLNTNR